MYVMYIVSSSQDNESDLILPSRFDSHYVNHKLLTNLFNQLINRTYQTFSCIFFTKQTKHSNKLP